MKTWYIIPARKGSRGLPLKNRKLLQSTLNIFPEDMKKSVILSTNDQEILKKCREQNILALKRPEKLSGDLSSTKEVLTEIIYQQNIKDSDNIVMLYLTYPQRTLRDVELALQFFNDSDASSMLCSKKANSHPYLCMFKNEGNKGRQVVKHDLYRRQDYPECFELSHFICIFKVSELNRLNNNLYNENTIYYPIENIVDIDTPSDYMKWLKN